MYGANDLFSVIHRDRLTRALQWIDDLDLPAGSTVLEIGCGAGVLGLELASRGFTVHGIDASAEMVSLANREAAAAGVSGAFSAEVGDAHSLQFPDSHFGLVTALGVLPFLHSQPTALREMARVARSDGHVLLTSDNRYRLNHLLDPSRWPVSGTFSRFVRGTLLPSSSSSGELPVQYLSTGQFAALLSEAGLFPVRRAAIGYGPLTFFGRSPIPERTSVAIHRRLQQLADRGLPGLSAIGAQDLVLAVHARSGA
ncbi:MAG: class I SAM-dependent methyltransferase [Chloroflexota bacterium]